ncbi:MAG: galactose-1-phosphate uridylyltransferase [candidate division NC10 bacterium]|nr:galactose-1-phosphate uridylyltransferase [candidate division NC10 bacterium]
MGELRKDPVVDRWVIIDPQRVERGALFQMEEPAGRVEKPCPFCQGSEGETPSEIFVLGEPGRKPNDKGWWVRVIPDKNPILRIEGGLERRAEGMFDLMNAVGAHEIVIETPDHYGDWSSLEDVQMRRILETYRARSLDLRNDRRFRQVMVVKNHGRAVSLFEHPHSHIVAFPVVPKGIEEEIQGVISYYRRKERCVFCDILKEELRMGRRSIFESRGFLAFAPFASRFPFETWILPKRHSPDFGEIKGEEIADLARTLKATMGMAFQTLANLSCSLIMHTGPLHEYSRPEYHWHMEIVPRLSKVAGFEWGTGFFVNPIPPEEAAARLKGERTSV